MSQPKRCPTCLNVLPLARRKCPYCNRIVPVEDQTLSPEIAFLQEKLAGKFEIISEIHCKGKSVLYLAQDLILERKVALKTIKLSNESADSTIDIWNQNLNRCLRLDDPHLARIYTYGRAGSLNYIILEFIADNTLEELLSEITSPLPLWKCLRIGRDIAQGLHTAHNIGVAHHRLTPSNISVSSDGFCRILDLGAAQGTIDALNKQPWSSSMESSQFFAPEQIESGISEPLSDQYRIGAILYRILANRPAYIDSGDTGAICILQENPRSIREYNPDVPVELENIILKAMSRDPNQRFPDCHQLALELEGLDPDYWLAEIDPSFRAATSEATVALLLEEIHRNEKDQNYFHAVALSQQALALAPYNTEVTGTLLRVRHLHEKKQELDSLVNKALISFYADNLADALKTLNTGRKIDKNNSELLRLTHEVMREQERHRLITALVDAAKIALAKRALSSAMSNVIRILDIDPGNKTAIKIKQKIEFGMEDRATLGVLVARAESAYKSDDLEKSISIIDKINDLDPNNFHAKKLLQKISVKKNHLHLVNLWNTLDVAFNDGDYKQAISILKDISKFAPSLKSEIRSKLLCIRERLAEQELEESQGETRPLRAVKPSDLSSNKPVETVDPIEPPEDSSEQADEEKELVTPRRQGFQISRYWVAGAISMCIFFIFWGIHTGSSDRYKSTSDTKNKIAALTAQPTQTVTPEIIPADTAIPEPSPSPTPTATMKPISIPTIPDNSNKILSLLKTALKNENNGNYKMAEICYRQILTYDRSHQQALKGLRDCQSREKKPAVRKKKKNLRHNPDNTRRKSKPEVNTGFIIQSVRCIPETPVRNKSLRLTIELNSESSPNIAKLWVNYKNPDDMGFSQLFATRNGKKFEVLIPKNTVSGVTIQYFLNAVDSNNLEYFFGSPDKPKTLP